MRYINRLLLTLLTYRVLCLVIGMIFLNKYSDSLCTYDLQFGFKAGHSTSMCSMILKEALAYYIRGRPRWWF